MAYVIAEPCIGTKDRACVDACPVDCIHPKADEAGSDTVDQLFIDPVECIDCGACVPVCPVSAIFAGDSPWCEHGWNGVLTPLSGQTRPLTSRLILNAETRVVSVMNASACRSNIMRTCSS